MLLPKAPAFALTAEEYDAGIRLSGASGGRGANALLKTRAESGVVRTGLIEDPLFKSGTIFDQLKNADGSATDVTFTFPERGWVFSRGPNLDVRNVQTSDSAFLLVAKGKNVDTLKKKWRSYTAPPAGSSVPHPGHRSGAAAAADRQRLYVFGGTVDNGLAPVDDMWAFTLATGEPGVSILESVHID